MAIVDFNTNTRFHPTGECNSKGFWPHLFADPKEVRAEGDHSALVVLLEQLRSISEAQNKATPRLTTATAYLGPFFPMANTCSRAYGDWGSGVGKRDGQTAQWVGGWFLFAKNRKRLLFLTGLFW